MFRNYYRCPCGHEWVDEWSATCDDRCPECGTSCSPTESEDISLEDEEQWEPCGDPRPKAFKPDPTGFAKVLSELTHAGEQLLPS
jgi:hypothetical protein